MTDTPTSQRPLSRDVAYAIRYYLGGLRTLYLVAGVLIIGGIAANWGWLVAIGVAPILIALLPCAAMCALGLCMHKMTGAHDQHAAGAHDASPTTRDLVDPVSGRSVSTDAAIASVHQGKIYFFENRANRDAFEAAPEKFLSAVSVNGRSVATQNKSAKASHAGHGCCG